MVQVLKFLVPAFFKKQVQRLKIRSINKLQNYSKDTGSFMRRNFKNSKKNRL
jgi:hypothetical protein